VVILATGSSGNALVVRSGGTAVLVDAGVSALQVRRRLEAAGLELSALEAVVVTHEHTDHVRGLEVLLRRRPLPVWATPGTWGRLRVDGVPGGGELTGGRPVRVGPLELLPVATCHDAAEPVALVISDGERRLALCTDTGIVTPLLEHRLGGCEALLLEANHDLDLLRHGPYPWPLKQRIRSRLGHLSNDQSAEAVDRLTWEGLRAVVGLHLSEQNNHPELVTQALRRAAPPGAAVAAVTRHEMLRLSLDGGGAELEWLQPPPARRRAG